MSRAALQTVVPENSVRFLGHATHEHEVPHLIYAVRGIAELVIDGRPVTLRARQCAWLAAHVPHSARLPGESMALGPFLSPGTSPAGRFQVLGEVQAICEVMTTVLDVGPHTSEQVQPFRAELDAILAGLGREHFPLTRPESPVARAIADDSLGPATLGGLAAAHGVSVRHVQRLFLLETGLPFHRWRTRARLNLGLARLAAGCSVPAASASAGYATRGGFLKALARETGTPMEVLTKDPAAVLGASATEHIRAD